MMFQLHCTLAEYGAKWRGLPYGTRLTMVILAAIFVVGWLRALRREA